MKRLAILFGCLCTCAGIASAETGARTHVFPAPIDAVSFAMPSKNIDLEVRGQMQSGWSVWERLAMEDEQDPVLMESSLVLFPAPVSRLEIRGSTLSYTLHPIRVSDAPTRFLTASVGQANEPHILTRSEWGADDSLLFTAPKTTRSDASGDSASDASQTANGEAATPKRVTDCEEMQRLYPSEFKADNRVTRDPEGRTYRWPLTYSPKVRLLVVHHTAMKVNGDIRSGVERVRALYQYHTNSRGWGDIGYNYLVDETGHIYEGKAGGPMVVGGHAYCNNTGTMGIALLGNFDLEKPSQEQVRALQWLLRHLEEIYDIPTDRDVRFHGKILSPVVGHRDLLSTDCPGYYAYGVLDQIRTHVREGNVSASVTFPSLTRNYVDRSAERKAIRAGVQTPVGAPVKQGLAPMGSMDMSGPPGGQIAFSMSFAAGDKPWKADATIGTLSRSDEAIGLWQEKNGAFIRLRAALTLPESLKSGGTELIRFKLQFPPDAGEYTLQIDKWTYVLHVSGRRVRTRNQTPQPMRSQQSQQARTRSTSSGQVPAPLKINSIPKKIPVSRSSDLLQIPASSVSSKSSAATIPVRQSSPQAPSSLRGGVIRIRLSYPDSSARILVPASATLNGSRIASPDTVLRMIGSSCISDRGHTEDTGIVRIDAGENTVTISSWNKLTNQFRGILECRVINGKLMLINELPFETYLRGLAEESDTEPLEKQKAFAVAARTYAAFYLDPAHRKFPDMPYDGSDSPAEFQSYGGAVFEVKNPQWVLAVNTTAGQVLMKNNQIIKAPYFHSDDGRTRAPEEISSGWKNGLLFPEIFTSKPDPWCKGLPLAGHGVGMSGCGALGQAKEGKTAEEILRYYYPSTTLQLLP